MNKASYRNPGTLSYPLPSEKPLSACNALQSREYKDQAKSSTKLSRRPWRVHLLTIVFV